MIRKLVYTCFLISIIAVYNTLLSQLDPNMLTSYSETEGSVVKCVLSDRMGNIWMATYGGLMKYDGYELKLFPQDLSNSKAMGATGTNSLHEDRKGNIWIGSMGLISKYDPITRTFQNYKIDNHTDFSISKKQAWVEVIISDGNGTVFFGIGTTFNYTPPMPILYYNEEGDTIQQVANPKNIMIDDVYDAATDPQGNPWFRCDNGVFVIENGNDIRRVDIHAKVDEDGNIENTPIEFDSEGLLWTGLLNTGIYSYDPVTGESKSYAINDACGDPNVNGYPIDFVFDEGDNLWIATSNGVVYFDHSDKSFSCLDWVDDPTTSIGVVHSISIDGFGDVWIGTRERGVLRYGRKKPMRSVISRSANQEGLTSGWAFDIIESDDGKIWIATEHGDGYTGLNVLDLNTNSIHNYPVNEFPSDVEVINAFFEMKPGVFLISANSKFYEFDVEANTFLPTKISGVPDSVGIKRMYSDSKHNTWICAETGLYVRYANSDMFGRIEFRGHNYDSLKDYSVKRVYESEEHGLWVLTYDGLYLYDYELKNLTRHGGDQDSGDAFIAQSINALSVDSEGSVWVGIWEGGLNRYDVASGQIVTYTIDDGLPSSNIQGMLEDVEGHALWLSTFEGISRMDLETEQFTNFSIKDGVQGKMFGPSAYLKTSDGLFVFGGNNGITIFDPREADSNALAPSVFITELEIANASAEAGTNTILVSHVTHPNDILLDYNQNSISIDYNGIHYANPAKNQFAYKLENYSEDWLNVGSQRTAHYFSLPPGEYTFRVKAANSNGIWSDGEAKIKINISPPWWRTWWAYLIYGLCFVIGIFAIASMLRRRVIEKQIALTKDKELAQAKEIEKAYEKLKTTQTQLIHAEKMASLGELTAGIAHEIQNPLNFVNNFAEVSVDLLEEMDEELDEGNSDEVKAISGDLKLNLQKINLHGKRASGIVRGMLEHSRSGDGHKESTDLNALAEEYLRLAYHGIRAKDNSFNADLKVELDDTLPKVNVKRQEIGRVMLNLISNAFHAVRLKAKESDDKYHPTVTVITRSAERAEVPEIISTGEAEGGKGGSKHGYIQIIVKDNGCGIPKDILDKIFQPFFTTKPTGEGTGLGLSLSYNIITAHDGKLEVKTVEGEGSEFVIELPLNIES